MFFGLQASFCLYELLPLTKLIIARGCHQFSNLLRCAEHHCSVSYCSHHFGVKSILLNVNHFALMKLLP
jgi:hypothetical protein